MGVCVGVAAIYKTTCLTILLHSSVRAYSYSKQFSNLSSAQGSAQWVPGKLSCMLAPILLSSCITSDGRSSGAEHVGMPATDHGPAVYQLQHPRSQRVAFHA